MFSHAPLVVIGMHRSGTTLLSQVLQRADVLMGRDVTAYGESNFFQRCNVELLKREQAEWDKPIATADVPSLFNTRHWLTEYANAFKHPLGWWPLLRAKGWGWKDPRNTYTLGSWLKIFPQTHAIHIYRNGIDVSRSLHARNAMLQPHAKWHSPLLNDLQTCFDLWEQYVQQAQSWKAVLAKRYIAVRYEDLTNMKPEAIESLEDFTGRKLHGALQHLVNSERRSKEPTAELDALREKARTNQTFLRLGYAV
jgi:hypothetical protein